MPSGRTTVDPTPKGAIICERRIGPLLIFVILREVQLRNDGLALRVDVSHRKRCRPAEAPPSRGHELSGFANERGVLPAPSILPYRAFPTHPFLLPLLEKCFEISHRRLTLHLGKGMGSFEENLVDVRELLQRSRIRNGVRGSTLAHETHQHSVQSPVQRREGHRGNTCRFNPRVQPLVVRSELLIVRAVSGLAGAVYRDYKSWALPPLAAYSAGNLDVLGRGLWLPYNCHQGESLDVDPNLNDVGTPGRRQQDSDASQDFAPVARWLAAPRYLAAFRLARAPH